MKITKRYLYPPRPLKDAVPRESLDMYNGWLAQLKYNDQHCTISIDDSTTQFHNRHNGLLKSYPDYLNTEITQVRKQLNLQGWSYLDGGVLQNKSRFLTGLLVIWDILVNDSEWLLGSSYKSRYESLLAITSEKFVIDIGGKSFDIGLKLSDHILIPKMYNDHEEAYALVDTINKAAGWDESAGGEPVLEGVVMKSPSGVLGFAISENNNTTWSVRSRVRTGRHRF